MCVLVRFHHAAGGFWDALHFCWSCGSVCASTPKHTSQGRVPPLLPLTDVRAPLRAGVLFGISLFEKKNHSPPPSQSLPSLYNYAMGKKNNKKTRVYTLHWNSHTHTHTVSVLLRMLSDVLHNPIKGNECGLCCSRKLPCCRSVKLV